MISQGSQTCLGDYPANADSIDALITMLHQEQMDEPGRIIPDFEIVDSPKGLQQFRELFNNAWYPRSWRNWNSSKYLLDLE